MAYLLLAIAVFAIGAVFMLDTAIFHPDPLGEIAMVFLPPIQFLFLAGIWQISSQRRAQ
jgi:hypothetical protein